MRTRLRGVDEVKGCPVGVSNSWRRGRYVQLVWLLAEL